MTSTARRAPARLPTLGGLFLSVPLMSLLLPQAPLLTIAATGASSLGILAMTSPGTFLGGAAVLTAAIPKAGVVVGGLPLPAMMFVLISAAVMLRLRTGPSKNPGLRIALMTMFWLSYRLLSLYLDGGSLTNVAALAGWYGLPVLLLLIGPALGTLPNPIGRRWARGLENGILLACGFSLVQQVLGLERTAVPGITRAVGVDYSSKPLAFEGGSKIPSTYQNGNILGVVTAVFFLVSTDRVLRGRGSQRDKLIMAATAVATMLSGSRTAVIGLVLGLGVLMVRAGVRRQTLVTAALCTFVVGLTLKLSPALSRRLTGTSASDPALAQRTEFWSFLLHTTPIHEMLIGGSAWAHPLEPPGLAEGVFGAVQQVGIIGVALFVAVFLVATSPPHLRRWRVLFIPVAISLATDSAFLVFPTLFLPIARMFSPLDPSEADQASARPVLVTRAS